MSELEDIWVELGVRRYPVRTESGGPERIAAHVQSVCPRGRIVLLTDDNVRAPHAEPVRASLVAAGRDVRMLTVAAGEASKSLTTMAGLWDEVLSGALDRSDSLVAIGGGVVGDIGGFLASTLLRGIRLVHVPTTVLAMSDASVGGKTGVNTAQGKNLVGTFYQPAAVIQWIGSLPTLSNREVSSGLAEVVKSALLAGEAEFCALEARTEGLAAGDLPDLAWGVRMAAGLKARIVSSDEREGGARRLLNFGHTLGHAIEHASGYGVWSHGEAVATGMVLALEYGERVGIGSSAQTARVRALLSRQKLPVVPPSLTLDEWTAPLRVDKKREGDTVNLILCARPGDCRVVPTPMAELVDWLRTLC